MFAKLWQFIAEFYADWVHENRLAERHIERSSDGEQVLVNGYGQVVWNFATSKLGQIHTDEELAKLSMAP